MENAIITEQATAPDYIRVILDKTKNNRTLALIIFKKLFDELPMQLSGIEDSINSGEYLLAEQTTHKLNGSVSFCGLTNIQEPAKNLEKCLINKDYQAIAQHLALLHQNILNFIGLQSTILADFGTISDH